MLASEGVNGREPCNKVPHGPSLINQLQKNTIDII